MRTELFSALSALALVASCGPGAISKSSIKNPLLQQTHSLPPQTAFVVGGSFEDFRETEMYTVGHRLLVGAMEHEADILETLQKLKELCQIDPFTDVNWGLMAGGADIEKEFAVVLGVNFDAAKANACAAGFGMEPSMQGAVTSYDRMSVYVTWPAENVIAFAFDEDALEFLLQVANGSPEAGPNPEVRALLSRVDPSATLWGVASALAMKEFIFEEFDFDEFSSHETVPISGEFRVRLGTSVQMSGSLGYPAAVDANLVVADWREVLLEVRGSGPLGFFLADLAVRVEGLSSLVEFSLTEEKTTGLLQFGERAIVAERERERRSDEEWEAGRAEREADQKRAREKREAEARANKEREAKEAMRQARVRAEEREAAARQLAAAKAEKTQRAKAHSDQGRAYLDARVYDKAVEEFKAANALIAHPDFLYNIAFSYDNQRGQGQQALSYYQRYLAAAPSGTMADVSRRRVAKITKKLRAR